MATMCSKLIEAGTALGIWAYIGYIYNAVSHNVPNQIEVAEVTVEKVSIVPFKVSCG